MPHDNIMVKSVMKTLECWRSERYALPHSSMKLGTEEFIGGVSSNCEMYFNKRHIFYRFKKDIYFNNHNIYMHLTVIFFFFTLIIYMSQKGMILVIL